MHATSTFRIFVSSTFSDLKAERNALHEKVFPRLRGLCESHGCRFQAIDLRWGVSEEAGLNQQTMKICLGEIERCQTTSPRPNFIILLGNRYGWQPLPYGVPSDEFEMILPHIPPTEQALIQTWYRRDDNAVPPVYVLQPRTGKYEGFEAWAPVERQMHTALEAAAQGSHLAESSLIKYCTSATEQEIVQGALNVEGARDHILCFTREIENLPQDIRAKDYLDLDEKNQPDRQAIEKLARLKSRLENTLHENVHHYAARWSGNGSTTIHIGTLPDELSSCLAMLEDRTPPNNLCEAVWRSLAAVIQTEISFRKESDPLQTEIDAHAGFARERARIFTGRAEPLAKIAAYMEGNDKDTLAVWGASGSGKSALMARAVHQAIENHPSAQIIFRFIGATPDSSDARALLESLARQITRAYGEDEASIPLGYTELVQDFPKRLSLARPQKPLWIFIDALDQLSPAYNARNLAWLPAELPEGVRLVVSTLPGECQQSLEHKLPGQHLFELLPMSSDQGKELLDIWLSEARRTLQPGQSRVVLNNFGTCGLPLYLKLAFEEACLWTSYAQDTTLRADVPGVIRDLFTRLSFDANHGEVLVSHALSYLTAARNGLSEDEMLDMLSRDEPVIADFLRRSPKSPRVERLPVVVWSRLYFDLKPYLVERSVYGNPLFGFFHRQMAEIANADYLPDDENLIRHRALAEYFASHPLSMEAGGVKRTNQRKVYELPYQQTKAEMWPELEATLTDFYFIEAKCSVGLTYDLVRDYHRIDVRRPTRGTPFIAHDQRRSGLLRPLLKVRNKDAREMTGAPFSAKFRDFADFVENQAHILNKHPELTFQQAQLCPQDSAPARTAETLWKSGGYPRPWLRWVNKPPHRAPRLGTYVGHTGNILACTYSPDGKRIASMANELIIWDTESTAPLVSIHVEKGWNKDCEFSPDGGKIISPTGESCSLWDVDTGALSVRFDGHSDNVTACAFSPDGRRIVTSSWDKTLKVWAATSGKELLTLRGHKEILFDCDYSPDGKRIISASYDKDLKIWNASSGSIITSLTGHKAPVSACKYSPDGKFILSASFDCTLKLWDAKRGIEKHTLNGHQWPVNDCSFSPDGRYVVSVDSHGVIKFWDPGRSFELSTFLGHAGDVSSCAFSPDGEMLISGSSNDAELKVWDVRGLLALPALDSHHDRVISCVFSPNGKKVASTSHDQTAKLWDVESGALIVTLSGHQLGVVACAFTPDNQRLVTASLDKTLRIWDVNRGDLLSTMSGLSKAVRSMTISPDGRRMLSISEDQAINIWDLSSRKRNHHLDTDHANYPGLPQWEKQRPRLEGVPSSDGDYILSAEDAWLRIRGVRTNNILASLVTEGAVTTCAWSSAGGTLVAGDTLGNVYLLKLEGIDFGPPLVTAWQSSKDDSVAFGCPWCYRWSPVSKAMLGTVVPCLQCGSLVNLDGSVIHADWIHIQLGLPEFMLQGTQDIDEPRLHEFGNYPNLLQKSNGEQALVLKDLGLLDGALKLFRDQERICRKNDFMDWLQWSLASQAQILYKRSDLQGALSLYQESGQICRARGDKHALQFSIGREGLILHKLGDMDNALALYIEREHLCREIGEKFGLYASLCNQGLIYHDRGDLMDALRLYKESEDVCRELDYQQGLCILLGNQGEALQALGDLDGAMALYREQESKCRELNFLDGLEESLVNQALVFEIRGDSDGADRLREAAKHLSGQES